MNISKAQLTLLGVGASGFLIGAGVSFIVTRKIVSARYEDRIDREIFEAKKYYFDKFKGESPVELVKKYGDILTEEKYSGDEIVVEDKITLTDLPEELDIPQDVKDSVQESMKKKINKNIFQQISYMDKEEFDYDAEVAKRSPDAPYIITHDEYMAAELDYNQVTLTYYLGDGVLSDDRDQPVPNIDETVGSDNVDRFGYGSNDPNVVYIRNDKLGIDVELLKADGDFAEVVLGFIQHSDRRPKIRKFRGDDE